MKKTKPNIAQLKPYIAGKSHDEIRKNFGLEDVIKLGSNENPLGASPLAVASMSRALESVAIYPDGNSQKILDALSEYYQLPAEYFLPGNGSDEILLMICAAYLSTGDEVLISENTFSQYECCSIIFDARIKKIPLRDYKYDLAGFTQSLSPATKICFLCNPNNPTGTIFQEQELEAFLNNLPEDCLVVMDEAYGDYADSKDFPHFQKLVQKYPQLIVCKTFSKLFALAGVRLGFAIAHPSLIEGLQKVKNFNPFNVNLLAQAAGSAVLSDTEFIKKSKELVLQGRKTTEQGLHNRGFKTLPSQANFICFENKNPEVDLGLQLEKSGVIIRHLKSFSMPKWYRVTIGTEKEMERFFRTLDEIFERL